MATMNVLGKNKYPTDNSWVDHALEIPQDFQQCQIRDNEILCKLAVGKSQPLRMLISPFNTTEKEDMGLLMWHIMKYIGSADKYFHQMLSLNLFWPLDLAWGLKEVRQTPHHQETLEQIHKVNSAGQQTGYFNKSTAFKKWV